MPNPIKPSFKSEWFALALLVLFARAALFFQFNLPARVVIHWDIAGQPNGWGSGLFAAWFLPLLALVLYLLLLFLPRLDPKPEHYESFKKSYHYFKDLILSFLFVVYLMTNLRALGYPVDIGFYLPLLIGALFIFIGFFLRNIKPNWFVGIRTPWTLSSESVWIKTHKLSLPVFSSAGILLALSVFAPLKIRSLFYILAILALVLILPIYSYIIFRQEAVGEKNLTRKQ